MKFLVLFACALAAASASHVAIYDGHHGHGYHGPIHLPIINHEGVPVDTAAVQHAAAAHLAHKANVHARNGDHLGHHVGLVAHGGYGHGVVLAHAAPLLAHGGYAHGLVAAHGLSHHGLIYRKRRGIHAVGYHGYHGPIHLPIINHEGVPVNTASVQHAAAAHLAHKANVHARNGDYHHGHHGLIIHGHHY